MGLLFILVLPARALLCGCGPSQQRIHDLLSEQVDEESKHCLGLQTVSVLKDTPGDFMGRAAHTIYYDARLAVVQDCCWLSYDADSQKHYFATLPIAAAGLPVATNAFTNGTLCRKGQTVSWKGRMVLGKFPDGWMRYE